MRESRRRIEDTTEPQKEKKKDRDFFVCFRTKTARIEQLLFDPIGPFSQVLSHIVIIYQSYLNLLSQQKLMFPTDSLSHMVPIKVVHARCLLCGCLQISTKF